MVVENDYYPPFSSAEYERRYRLVREFMEADGLECLIVYGAYSMVGTDTGQVNAVYLSNYAGIVQTYVVFPLRGEPTLFLSFGYHIPNARNLSVIKDIRWPGFDLARGVCDRLRELGLEEGRIGVVGPFSSWFDISIPVEHHHTLTATLPRAKFRVVTKGFENVRLVKSAEEIRYLERGAAMTDVAQEAICLATRPGVRHSELRDIAFDVAGRCGGKVSLYHVSSTPMANPQEFYPDCFPTHRKVEAGDVVMTEISVGYGGYFGKLFATYFMGEPSSEYRRLVEIAATVYDEAVATLKPGSTGRDVGKLLAPIREAGYTTGIVLVGGWSAYNHPPNVGAIEESFGASTNTQDSSELEFVFKPGHCVGIMSYPITKDLKRGVWMGSICVFTEDRLRRLHSYPVSTLRVV
jgi:Xaa-Pro aminopeptidase